MIRTPSKGLLTDLNKTEEQFCDLIQRVRNYRDKFVSHLNSDRVINPPFLDDALKALRFYHRHVVEQEAASGDLCNRANTAAKMGDYYQQCIAEATQIYSRIASRKNFRRANSPAVCVDARPSGQPTRVVGAA